MKVTEIKTFLVNAQRQNWLFVKVLTDEGIYGWGEASIEHQEQAVQACIQTLAQRSVIGEDPHRVEYIWQKMHRHGFWKGGWAQNSAIAGIDQALWDIKGKALGVPVYSLLGGKVRDSIKAYTHGTPETAEECMALGFAGIKMGSSVNPGFYDPAEDVKTLDKRLGEMRAIMGPDAALCVDSHGKGMAAEIVPLLAVAEKHSLYFLEEPCVPDNVRLYKKIHDLAKIPIAGGERWFSRYEYREILEGMYIDIVQPDICHCGGISEIKRIANYAETYSVRFAPHNPNGPVATAASIQVCAAMQNFDILESHRALYLYPDMYNLDFKATNGAFAIPDGPGLGIELDESLFSRHPYMTVVSVPRYREDGSVAEM